MSDGLRRITYFGFLLIEGRGDVVRVHVSPQKPRRGRLLHNLRKRSQKGSLITDDFYSRCVYLMLRVILQTDQLLSMLTSRHPPDTSALYAAVWELTFLECLV